MQRHHTIALASTVSVAVLAPMAVLAVPATAGTRHPKAHVTSSTVPAALPKTASYSFSATLTGIPGSSTPVTIQGTIAADLVGGSTEITATLPAGIGPIGAGTLDLIISGKTIYVSTPGLSTLTGGRPWASMMVPAGMAHGALGTIDARAQQVVGNVPGVVSWLTTHPAAHPFASVTGTSTTPAGITTSMLVTIDRHDGRAPKPAGSTKLPTSVPVSLTADTQGRLIGATGSFSVGPLTASGSLTSTGFDAPITITPPAADQTFVVPPSLMGMLGGLLGSHHMAEDAGGPSMGSMMKGLGHSVKASLSHLEASLHLGS